MSKKMAIAVVLAVCMAAVSGAYALGFMHNEDAQQAIEAGDYEGFIAAVSAERNERFAEMMTEERFEQLQETYMAREAVQSALESGDYEAWVKAQEEMPRPPKITDVITEDNFSTFVEMNEALESGDMDSAKELAEELGLNGFGMAMGHRKAGPAMGFGKAMRAFGEGCHSR